ncbi:double-strand break repair protein AddB [Elioraea tepida]|uniref:Double-strand break repair protein AddB n=1 Tax=Elioraea tepida TaxID=2843330 RepID=A0A975U5F1_9PROT|nr:double-strand break repair protein AddB [Elioraea tepida]QXM25743.1 double-strand break repair protein AddB [Elioraea tepida]
MGADRRRDPAVFTIPPEAPFLDSLAAGLWRDAKEDQAALARMTVVLPTRRAARGLAEAFLRLTEGRPLLLPRTIALAEAADEGVILAGLEAPPPAVGALRRQAALARLVLAKERAAGVASADHAFRLAGELATLLDEMAREEADPARLADAAEAAHAEHWLKTIAFLEIVTSHWPRWLADNGLADPAARLVALLESRRRHWERSPPESPVIAAGSTGGIPAVGRLLATVARLPAGAVVLPGLDLDMDAAAWEAIGESHPQAGLKRLLGRLGVAREEVRPWPGAGASGAFAARARVVSRMMLPAEGMGDWRRVEREAVRAGIAGLGRIDAADQNEEALVIALAMRAALETPGRRAALVTPDRALAARVSAALARFGIRADDSAGRPLGATPPGVYLRLLVTACAERLAPVPLLALLKHPLASGGMRPGRFRAAVRLFELALLRGQRPAPGIAGLEAAYAHAARLAREHRPRGLAAAARVIEALKRSLGPLLAALEVSEAPPARLLAATLAAAEALAATDTAPGARQLWAQEAGEAAAARMAEALEALEHMGPIPPESWPGLFEALFAGVEVRLRRIGSAGEGAPHPRLFIWGVLEARLQSAELVILGGLNEGTWPAAVDPGPWMSRPMRTRFGLASPEAAIGEAAHDVALALSSAPEMLLTRARRVDGAPTVPSRWLVRLDAFLESQLGPGDHLRPPADWLGIARALDAPDCVTPEPRAEPRPPLALRPKRLSVTEVERLLRDPFEIYAKHILGLRRLPELDEPIDRSDWGTVVHAAIASALRRMRKEGWPGVATFRHWIEEQGARSLEALAAPAREAFWRPRLARIAKWVAEAEERRLAEEGPVESFAEVKGELALPGGFVLHGRADRIDRLADGTLRLIDYKTGTIPPQKEIEEAYAIQLPLEAAMAERGAFAEVGRGIASHLAYWKLGGGFKPGAKTPVKGDAAALAAAAWERFEALRARFDDPSAAYWPRPHPHRAPQFSDYLHLARVEEWGGGDD